MPFWKKKIYAEPLIDLEPANAHQIGVRTLVVCPVAGCDYCCIMPALWERYWGDPSGELYCPTHDEPLVDVRKFIVPFSQRIAKLMFDPTINPPPDLDARVARVDPTALKQFRQIWKFLMFYVRGAEKWAYIYNTWEFNTPAKNLTEDEKTEQLYTLTRVPFGKGLAHEGKNRFEVYHEDHDWVAQWLYYYEKKIGSFLPEGFKWKNIMEHFHEVAEWRPESWNVINPPAARLPRLSCYVIAEIGRWLNERINAIGWGIKRLMILKMIPEQDLQTQKGILDWYCIGQTAALFLNYETRVWNWLDPQLFLRNDKRPIPLDWAHSLGFPVAKGHLPMRIDPSILLQYYTKFYDAGLTHSNAEQARVRFDKNGGSVVGFYSTQVTKGKSSSKKNPKAKQSTPSPSNEPVPEPSSLSPEAALSSPLNTESISTISEHASIEDIKRHFQTKIEHNSVKNKSACLLQIKDLFQFTNSSPPEMDFQVKISKSQPPSTINVHNVVVDSNLPSELEFHEDRDSSVCFLDGGFEILHPLRCKLVPSANECLIAKEIAQNIALIRPLSEPWFVYMHDNPKIECRSHGRLILHLDEDQHLLLNVFVPEISLGDVDVIIGDSGIMRFGLYEKSGEIFASNYENGYRCY